MKKIILLAGVIILLVVGYVAAGPYLTVSAIKTGIVEKDSEKLSENIDFKALRQNLKDQLNVEILKNAATGMKGNPFAALAAGFATKMVDGMVDSFVTPSGLASVMEGKKLHKNQGKNNTDSSALKKDELFKNASFSYDSISKFSIYVPDQDGKETRFILKRDGLSWKLVNIMLPKEAFKSR